MREAKLLYRSLAWRTITLARLRVTDASGIKLSDPLLLPSDIGPPMGVQPNVISERNEKKKNPKNPKKREKSGLAGGRKRTGGISDTTRGRESVRRTMCRWPRLCARCARGSRRQVTARSLTLWIHERQGQSESPSAATSASSDRSSAFLFYSTKSKLAEAGRA